MDPLSSYEMPTLIIHSDRLGQQAWKRSTAQWQEIRYRGNGKDFPGTNDPDHWNEFIFGLLDAGEVLIDDLSVVEDPDGSAVELIQKRPLRQWPRPLPPCRQSWSSRVVESRVGSRISEQPCPAFSCHGREPNTCRIMSKRHSWGIEESRQD